MSPVAADLNASARLWEIMCLVTNARLILKRRTVGIGNRSKRPGSHPLLSRCLTPQ